MATVKLNVKQKEEHTDEDMLEDLSIDSSWLDGDFDNDSIEVVEEKKVPDNIVSQDKAIDKDRDQFVYDGNEDDDMSEDYFPDIAFEEDEQIDKETVETNVKTKKKRTVIKVVALLMVITLIAAGVIFVLGRFGII